MRFAQQLRYIAIFIFFCCPLVLLSYPVIAADLILSWDRPNDSRVSGYKIYCCQNGQDLDAHLYQTIQSPDQTQCQITNLAEGQQYIFAAKSFDSNGSESAFSDTLSYYVAPVDNDGDGFSVNDGDCDDNNAASYPGAKENCGDGIDQDCDGSDLPCTEDSEESDADLTNRLYYPHFCSQNGWETEICVINNSMNSLSAKLVPYDHAGNQISSRTLVVPANGRHEIIVGSELASPEDIRYVILMTDHKEISGYTKFYREGKCRAAIPAVHEVNKGDLYIPHIESTNKWWTGIGLVNTTASTKSLDIDFNTGQTAQIMLNAGEQKNFLIRDLFSGDYQERIESAVITGAQGVIGLELFGRDKQLSGVALKNETARTLHFPHLANDHNWWTGIAVYNPNNTRADLSIKPCNASGKILSIQNVSLPPKEKYIGTVSELNLPADTVWFEFSSSLPLSGFELFGQKSGKTLAGYSAVNNNKYAGVFAKMDHEGWTGIAFVNTASQFAEITLTACDDDGAEVCQETLILAGHEKIAELPHKLFHADLNNCTYIRFSANREVVGFQLNGSSDGMMLDGLPSM